MAKTIYNGKEYNSKAEIIRELFNNGKLKNESYSKKEIAKELGISVQTVHATLIKVIEGSGTEEKKVKLVSAKGKTEEIIILHGNEEAVGVNNKKKIKVSWAPNPWNLPITNPPTYVIDPNFKGDIPWTCEKESNIDSLIQF
jgi:predicted DNA-binding protein YlxM (UPF0122 family)